MLFSLLRVALGISVESPILGLATKNDFFTFLFWTNLVQKCADFYADSESRNLKAVFNLHRYKTSCDRKTAGSMF